MLVDVTLVFRMLPMVLAVTITIVLVKAVVATGALWWDAATRRRDRRASVSQIGEFSFILGRAGLDLGLLSPDEWDPACRQHCDDGADADDAGDRAARRRVGRRRREARRVGGSAI